MIDEQQRLLGDVHRDSNTGGGSTTTTTTITPSTNEQMSSTTAQHIVAERKQQRQALLVKRDRINGERENQMLEKKEILSMLEQLLTLEARFVLVCFRLLLSLPCMPEIRDEADLNLCISSRLIQLVDKKRLHHVQPIGARKTFDQLEI